MKTDDLKSINVKALKRSLFYMDGLRNRDFFFGIPDSPPLLTYIYKRIVFGEMTLSRSTQQLIEEVFLGYVPQEERNSVHTPVKVEKMYGNSKYDAKNNVWISTLYLEMKNHSDDSFREFIADFKLPSFARVGGMELKIGKKWKQALLSDKKSAVWVYNMITRRTRRDPAILFYNESGLINLRVFPFGKREKRYMKIRLVHARPFVFEMKGRKLRLGDKDNSSLFKSVYELNARRVMPEPEYIFVIDNSINSAKKRELFRQTAEDYIRKNNINNAKIYFGNYKLVDSKNKDTKAEGGFYVGGLLRQIATLARWRKEAVAPVVVFVTDNEKHFVYGKGISDIKGLMLGTTGFYSLDPYLNLYEHSWEKPHIRKKIKHPEIKPVYVVDEGLIPDIYGNVLDGSEYYAVE
ncbi:MAG: MSEP-CTERM sorting domain-containing protein, partial [Bacteroidetes bacterium]